MFLNKLFNNKLLKKLDGGASMGFNLSELLTSKLVNRSYKTKVLWLFIVLLLLWLLGFGMQAFAAPILAKAAKGNVLAAVRTVKYNPNRLYQINLKEGTSSTITLSSAIDSVSLGNGNYFSVHKVNDKTITVFALKDGVSTDLVLTDEDGYLYNLAIKTLNKGEQTNATVSLTVVRALAKPEVLDANKQRNFAVFGVDYNGHDVSKSKVERILPNDIWHDQNYIYLDYRGRNNIPIVEQSLQGIDTPINTIIKNGILIVYGVSDLVLQAGGEVVCVKLTD